MVKNAPAEFMDKMRIAGHPMFRVENQILAGRVVVTCRPSFDDAQEVEIRMPEARDVKENLCLPALFDAVFETLELWWPLMLQALSVIRRGEKFAAAAGPISVTARADAGDWVITLRERP